VALESSIRTATLDNTGAAYYDISDSGTLVHITGEDRARAGLAWVAEDGTEEQLPIEPRVFGAIRLSSDQRRLVAEVADPVIGDQVYLFDVDRPNGTRLSVEGSNRNPVWGPEDEYVYFASDAAGDLDIYRRRVDMSSGPELVHAAPGDQIPAAIFPDGSGMVFVESSPSNNDIWRLDFAEAATPQPLAVTDDDERLPALSSDGGLLAYTAFVSGDWVVIVREMATGRRHQVGVGWAPVWSRNLSRLFFSNREDVIVRVEVTRRSPFEWGAVTRIAGLVDARNLDVGTDGKRILVPRPVDGEVRGDSIAVTLNWFDELRSRVPPSRD
jgi:Tol biopolymer transport system component